MRICARHSNASITASCERGLNLFGITVWRCLTRSLLLRDQILQSCLEATRFCSPHVKKTQNAPSDFGMLESVAVTLKQGCCTRCKHVLKRKNLHDTDHVLSSIAFILCLFKMLHACIHDVRFRRSLGFFTWVVDATKSCLTSSTGTTACSIGGIKESESLILLCKGCLCFLKGSKFPAGIICSRRTAMVAAVWNTGH